MKSIEYRITKFMLDHKCPAHYTGYQYLKDGIALLHEQESEINNMRSIAYEKVADRYRTGVINVERCLRVLADHWWERNKCGGLFPARPTNSQLVTVCAERLKSHA